VSLLSPHQFVHRAAFLVYILDTKIQEKHELTWSLWRLKTTNSQFLFRWTVLSSNTTFSQLANCITKQESSCYYREGWGSKDKLRGHIRGHSLQVGEIIITDFRTAVTPYPPFDVFVFQKFLMFICDRN
jgi:hypothetical protein